MDVKEFWAEVRAEAANLPSRMAGIKGQPDAKDGFCFITSRRDRVRNTTAGSVTVATLKLAAQRLVEQTHALSTAEEIDSFHAASHERGSMYNRLELDRKAQHMVVHQAAEVDGLTVSRRRKDQ